MNIRQIQEARELYGIDNWGAGYFSINDQGHVVCHPNADEHLAIDIPEVIKLVKSKGVRTPMILRFPQIINNQIEKLHLAFKDALWEYSYQGSHRGVFPFKVNQRREFIDNIFKCGQNQSYGLEVGSKTEFIAALSYDIGPDAPLVCNGFKDREFIKLGFAAKAMGKNIILIIEGPDELEMINEEKKVNRHCPQIGIRMKLYTRGSGKWAKSSGDSSKFGLTTIEVLDCLRMISDANLTDHFTMLHFHIGSQVTEIKRIKNAIKEATRVYAKIYKMGYRPRCIDIGGGIGVDYDGSKTSFHASANYSLREFASDVVYQIREVCENEDVPSPDILTESGRVIAAYHSVIITDIREIQGPESLVPVEDLKLDINEESHKGLQELKYILDNLHRKNFVEYYHDAIEYYDEMFTLFNLGYISLEDRGAAEQIFNRICLKALYYSYFDRHQLEEFEELQQRMVSKYLANFSIFQSIPDAWAIDQLFPVIPLSHHDQKPSQKSTIVDITCDSDGCLEKFVDRADMKAVLELHPPSDKPYYLGFFLVGAYQESLASEHNLFGATDEAEVTIDSNGAWEISKITMGEPIGELLQGCNYDLDQIISSFEQQLQRSSIFGILSDDEVNEHLNYLKSFMEKSPYLLEE